MSSYYQQDNQYGGQYGDNQGYQGGEGSWDTQEQQQYDQQGSYYAGDQQQGYYGNQDYQQQQGGQSMYSAPSGGDNNSGGEWFNTDGYNAGGYGDNTGSSSMNYTSSGFGGPSGDSSGGGQQPQYTSHGFGAPPPAPMDSNMDGSNEPYSFDDEPPLLEELGINFDHIKTKTLAVMANKSIAPEMLEDTDMAGPLVYCVMQGFFLMLTGKLYFGYVFGFGVVGCIWLYCVINLMNHAKASVIDVYRVFSVLGYCLLPIVILSGLAIVLDLHKHSWLGLPSAVIAILWCTAAATRFFEAASQMTEQRYLIAYPVLLLYACFALITVF